MRVYNMLATYPSIFCILKPLKNYETDYNLHLMKTPRNRSGVWQLPNIYLVICIYFITQYRLHLWQ